MALVFSAIKLYGCNGLAMSYIMTLLINMELDAMGVYAKKTLGLISAEEATFNALKIEARVNDLVHANLDILPCPLPSDFPCFTCQYVALWCLGRS